MVRVYLELIDNSWEKVEKSDFWIHERLQGRLERIKEIQRKDWDGLIIIDGKERSGKSLLAMQIGWYLSKGTLTKVNFAKGLRDAAKCIAELPDRSVLIVDEAGTVFDARGSAGKLQRELKNIMDVVGQKNMVFIFCLPCYFDLSKTMAVRRSLFLLHVKPDATYTRGNFWYWGEKLKAVLYRMGKKNFDSYARPKPEWQGSYPNWKPPWYEEYLAEVKQESLQQVLDAAIATAGSGTVPARMMKDQAKLCRNLKVRLGLNNSQISDATGLHQDTVRRRLDLASEIEMKQNS